MAYPIPPSSRSAVRKAGLAVSNGCETEDDINLIDQWRRAHCYVINTFQSWIKGHINRKSDLAGTVEFAQRLKRKKTVLDKLRRKDAEGNLLIKDVVGMHDFAGCRMIFDNIGDLNKFRSYMHSNFVMRNVRHQIRHTLDKYNYIDRPKLSGYRGIHDVYRHIPRGSDRTESSAKPWDGLLVEIQYRTRAQHAWATAVEISDLLDDERTKFAMDASERGHFFAIASEIIARQHEGLERVYQGKDLEQLKGELHSMEERLGILNRLQLLKQFKNEEKLKRHNVLNIFRTTDGDLELEVLSFATALEAIEKSTRLEEDESSVNAVYVRADNPKQLRSAYRNYFYDPVDFVKLLSV